MNKTNYTSEIFWVIIWFVVITTVAVILT